MNGEIGRVYVPKADFEMFFGLELKPEALGAMLTTHDGEILREYLFMDQDEELKFLESLYALEGKENASIQQHNQS